MGIASSLRFPSEQGRNYSARAAIASFGKTAPNKMPRLKR
jgi:hypothetical protein